MTTTDDHTGHSHDDHKHEDDMHHHGSAGHSHGVSANADARYLTAALVLLVVFLCFEVVMAFVGRSLALLADAGHMLTDAGALGASLFALRLARRPARGSLTFGFRRAEVLSALANGLTLVAVSGIVAVESIHRLFDPPKVEGGIVLTVAGVGVAVNVVATAVLAKANRDSINIKGSFAHIVTDLYAFIATLVAGVLIVTTGFRRADPIASLIVVALMIHTAWGLLKETGRILLEAAPTGTDPAKVLDALRATPGVASVHDLHVWVVTSGFPALSAHILVDPTADCHLTRRSLDALLRQRFGLEHTTLQVDHAEDELLTIGPPGATPNAAGH